jgi:hypothetical protein
MREQGESLLIAAVALLCGSQQMNKLRLPSFSHNFPILLRALNHSNDALPLPYQVTLVGLHFSGSFERPAFPISTNA